MVLRITTWNVNGIRNPFQYQPWRDKRTFASMFDILEADIIVFQETKIQRKDLRDDMVLVPGWDCYFSLPKHKKGYSGVVIYTRQSVCAPVRAEEGITGILCGPNSSTKFSELPKDQQIGGYPTPAQMASSIIDATTLDSEGRCVMLEFPALVLLGVYSPANRDEARDDFRLGFLDALDARIRNLIALGKRVVLTGDLNISREELDTANAEASMRKNGLTGEEYASTPARRLFNHLLEGGKVFGDRDEGRENPVLSDITRSFHPRRKGMFTCWEQKKNARPGNFGSRIDYVLCSLNMKDWFCDSNIQEGLQGSDHCPVYAIMKDKIIMDGQEVDVRDAMNPPGMFVNGKRKREYSVKDLLPLSGKLIAEFDRRRSIRDMFASKPSLSQAESVDTWSVDMDDNAPTPLQSGPQSPTKSFDSINTMASTKTEPPLQDLQASQTSSVLEAVSSLSPASSKRRRSETSGARSLKRVRSGSTTTAPKANGKGQQSLMGFFKSKVVLTDNTYVASATTEYPEANQIATTAPSLAPAAEIDETDLAQLTKRKPTPSNTPPIAQSPSRSPKFPNPSPSAPSAPSRNSAIHQTTIHDPIESKESWSRLFTKPAPPRCEGHNEPCITLLTKKSGINCGRSFWMCARPLGPTGEKEKGTQWRCQTFIWCSDWNPGGGT